MDKVEQKEKKGWLLSAACVQMTEFRTDEAVRFHGRPECTASFDAGYEVER